MLGSVRDHIFTQSMAETQPEASAALTDSGQWNSRVLKPVERNFRGLSWEGCESTPPPSLKSVDTDRFFNNRTITLHTRCSGQLVRCHAEGAGRSEMIDVYINGQKTPHTSDPNILDLSSKTFYPPNMYILDAINQQSFPVQTDVVSLGFVRCLRPRLAGERPKMIRDHFVGLLTDAFSRVPMPQRVTAKVLAHGTHWFLINIDLLPDQEEKGRPARLKVSVIDNLKAGVKEAQIDYYEKIGESINEACKSIPGLEGVKKEEIQIIARNQYGAASCGISCDLSEQRLQEGVIKPDFVLTEDDFIEKEQPLEGQQDTDRLRPPGLKKVIKPEAKQKKVTRNDIIDDVASRTLLHLEMLKRESLRRDLEEYTGVAYQDPMTLEEFEEKLKLRNERMLRSTSKEKPQSQPVQDTRVGFLSLIQRMMLILND